MGNKRKNARAERRRKNERSPKKEKIAINKVILFYHQLHIQVQFFPLNPYGCKHSSTPYSSYCNKSMLIIHSEFCYGVSVCNSGERKQDRDLNLLQPTGKVYNENEIKYDRQVIHRNRNEHNKQR